MVDGAKCAVHGVVWSSAWSCVYGIWGITTLKPFNFSQFVVFCCIIEFVSDNHSKVRYHIFIVAMPTPT